MVVRVRRRYELLYCAVSGKAFGVDLLSRVLRMVMLRWLFADRCDDVLRGVEVAALLVISPALVPSLLY